MSSSIRGVAPSKASQESPAPRYAPGEVRHGKWRIYYDPPPIPWRGDDWRFVHDDFDASWEGEEDGWVGNGLCGSAASPEACIAEIETIEEEC